MGDNEQIRNNSQIPTSGNGPPADGSPPGGAVPPAVPPSGARPPKIPPRRRQQTVTTVISDRKVLLFGALGGFLYAVTNIGFLKFDSFMLVVTADNWGSFQFWVLVAFGLILMAVGAIWAYVHIPIPTVAVALQLGLIAPVAVGTAIDTAADQLVDQNKETTWVFPGGLISSAYASEQGSEDIVYSSHNITVGQCIIRTLAGRRC
jgi:multisubunit Na+/H+ antiporter MnhG subunit